MTEHVTVLPAEAVELLCVKPDGIYVDATLGYGGHSDLILRKLKTGHLFGFDQDITAISASVQRLAPYGNLFTPVHDNFRNLKKDLEGFGVTGIDGMVMDLGVSSPMFDKGERGFSYNTDGPLDMRMDQSAPKSAYDVVNGYSERDLASILRKYGEEPFAAQIARNIVKTRSVKPIETTFELADVIRDSLPERIKRAKGHPAKRSFQAIRIEVNDELKVLEECLSQALEILNPDGRIAVISFHSLEDRMVKTVFKEASSIGEDWKKLPLKERAMPLPDYELIPKKPVTASEKELEANHRSHSAKLRVLRRR
ncbi:MAG: 16S rRNA (cytosine(1402)-N(4))-methyltransferase RsmH [Erysipelotrichales bacterium]|nr:16S rRNA (cytosine(1402)-N(4))-methyltransferase RsmH [Erysipelotrichales bacterium]